MPWIIAAALFGMWLSSEHPQLAGIITISILVLTAIMMVNPATGAALTLMFIGLILFIIFLYLLPYLFFFSIGVIFFILFIIGLGELVR